MYKFVKSVACFCALQVLVLSTGCLTTGPGVTALWYFPDSSASGSTVVRLDGIESQYLHTPIADVSMGLVPTVAFDAARKVFTFDRLVVTIRSNSDHPISFDQASLHAVGILAEGGSKDIDILGYKVVSVPGTAGYFVPGIPSSSGAPVGGHLSPGTPGYEATVLGGPATQRNDILPGQEVKSSFALSKTYTIEKGEAGDVQVPDSYTRYEVRLQIDTQVLSFAYRVQKASEYDTRGSVSQSLQTTDQLVWVPRGTMRLDGSTLDWAGILPIIVDGSGDSTGPSYTDLRAVYLAVDDQNIFLRFDLGETPNKPSSLGGYAVAFRISPTLEVILEAYHVKDWDWRARAIGVDPANRDTTISQLASGSCSLSDSGLEIMLPSFQLGSLWRRPGITGVAYPVSSWASVPYGAVYVTWMADPTVGGASYRVVDSAEPVSMRF